MARRSRLPAMECKLIPPRLAIPAPTNSPRLTTIEYTGSFIASETSAAKEWSSGSRKTGSDSIGNVAPETVRGRALIHHVKA